MQINPTSISRGISVSAVAIVLVGLACCVAGCIPALAAAPGLVVPISTGWLTAAAISFVAAAVLNAVVYARACRDKELIWRIKLHPTPQFNAVVCILVACALGLVIAIH